MKAIDILFGIKAEQTLRDATRAAAEEPTAGVEPAELCPVGKKDWIAGERIEGPIPYDELEKKRRSVVSALIALNSHQRIRHENVRVWAVRPPVPVFRDPVPDEAAAEPAEEPAADAQPGEPTGPVTCPVCGAEVHHYNIQYDPWGKMVGCYLCRGERKDPSDS
jgi:hypothetical protein